MNNDKILVKLLEYLRYDEGYYTESYWDNDHWSWGHGTPAPGPNAILPGETDVEQRTFAESEMIRYVRSALEWGPKLCKNWDKLNGPRKCAIANMIYNLGPTRLRSFRNTIEEWNRDEPDWILVGLHALDSKWYKEDVGRRALRVVFMLQKGEYHALFR